MKKQLFNIFIFSIFIFLASINTVLAVDCLTPSGDMESVTTDLDCTIAGGTVITENNITSEQTPLPEDKPYFGKKGDSIGQYISSIYKYAIGVVGILATIVIMIGGLIWITSMGNAQRVSSAKDWIGAALTGLALAMFSYTLLWIINPDLVNFKPLNLPEVGDIGGNVNLNNDQKLITNDEVDGVYLNNNQSSNPDPTCMGPGQPCQRTKCCSGKCGSDYTCPDSTPEPVTNLPECGADATCITGTRSAVALPSETGFTWTCTGEGLTIDCP